VITTTKVFSLLIEISQLKIKSFNNI